MIPVYSLEELFLPHIFFVVFVKVLCLFVSHSFWNYVNSTWCCLLIAPRLLFQTRILAFSLCSLWHRVICVSEFFLLSRSHCSNQENIAFTRYGVSFTCKYHLLYVRPTTVLQVVCSLTFMLPNLFIGLILILSCFLNLKEYILIFLTVYLKLLPDLKLQNWWTMNLYELT